MSTDRDVRFPMACPACSTVTAKPYAATAASEQSPTTIIMRCRHCGHEWQYDQPVSTDIAKLRSGVRLPIPNRKPDES